MLVLARYIGEEIVITIPADCPAGTEIVISPQDVRRSGSRGPQVRIGIEAPRSIAVWRREVGRWVPPEVPS
jgi:sRNA-binding carbon storage regulator CsrA